MAPNAQRTNIQQIALAATFDNRNNVIRVPKTRSLANLKSPLRPHHQTPTPTRRFQTKKFYPAIDAASRAYSVVTLEHTLTQVPRIRPQLPFMHAPIGAESTAAFRNFKVAPPAAIAALRSLG
jgi:hypothetical protein